MKVVVWSFGGDLDFRTTFLKINMIVRIALDVVPRTTLLNYILDVNHGKKIAIIENEFGEACIVHDMLSCFWSYSARFVWGWYRWCPSQHEKCCYGGVFSAKGKWMSCLTVRDRYSWHLEISPKNMLKMVRFVPKIFFKQSPVRRTSLRWTMAVFAARYEVILSLVSRNCTSRPLGRHEHQKQNRPSAKKHLHFWSDLLNFSHKLKLKRKLDMLEFRDLGHFKIKFFFGCISFSSSIFDHFFLWDLSSCISRVRASL